ncbi:MAG: chromosome partitioning protein ParA, partial [Bacteroidetes bacterium]|nr:chromosome partitioning protein ParA [Bacteroidota bacterium]
DLTAGLAGLLGAVAAVWLLAAGIEWMLWMPSFLRWTLFTLSLLAALVVFAWGIGIPLLRHLGWLPGREEITIARKVGRTHPEVGDRLLNLLQLADGRHSDSPEPFVDQAVQRLGEPLRDIDFDRIATWKTTLSVSKWASIPVLGVMILLLTAPGPFLDATHRLTHPSRDFEKPAPYALRVEPGDAELIIGGSLPVRIALTGTAPATPPLLEVRIEGELRSRFINLADSSLGAWTHRFENVRYPFRYRVSSELVTTPWFDVRLVDRPLVQQLNLRLTYPAYSRIPSQALDANVGDVTALVGTRVDVRVALAGAPSVEAELVFDSGASVPVAVDGNEASARFTVAGSDAWSIRLRSAEGIENIDPITYRVEGLQDGGPSVTLLSPGMLVDLNEDLSVGLLSHITDDFGFSRIQLHYRLSDSRFGTVSETFSQLDIPIPFLTQLDQEVSFGWELSRDTPLDPVPGDVIDYYLEVWDNDAVSGAKSAQSRIYQLRLPSLAERFERLDEAEDDTEKSIEELLDEAREAREQFDELKEELLEDPEAGFHEERLLEQLQEKQDNLEESVNAVSRKMEELAQQMQDNDMVSEQTMEMFEQLQQVVEEVRTPELMDALQNLQEALQNMDLNQMQEALEQFEFSEDMYQERLERTLDLFKQFRVQQDMEEIEERAQELAETEDKLAEETAKLENEQKAEEASGDNEQPDERNEELAQEQERASEDMKALEDKMEEVLERMQEMENMPSEDMQDLLEDTQDKEMSEQMQENAEQLRNNELQQAGQQQQDMSQQLSQMSSQMNEMQMNMQGAQMQLNIAAIRAVLEDVLTLSESQELLRLDIMDLATDSPLLREAAQQQVELLEGLAVTADSLQAIARDIPQMTRDVQQRAGDAQREMSEATGALTERAARRAAGHQRGAMTQLNELALLLSELLNQQMNGSGAGQSNQSMEQMMEQMQQMGQQQQQLNQQIQQLLNDMQGSRLTQDMMERLRQMGAQQEQIRNDLRQMNRNRDARNKMLGDLNRIADQMMETIEELQQNRVSERTAQRQQQILTRLLEASRSLEQRGEDNKREGRSAEEILRQSPAALPLNEQLERMRRDLIRALESGYSTDYEALIRRYFDLLQSGSELPQ